MSVLQRSSLMYGRKSPASVRAFPVHGKEKELGVGYMGGTSVDDSNLMVILAASLCAFACALGLISMLLRWTRRTGSESAQHAAITGLKKKRAIRTLPVIAYVAEAAADCPICLAEFVAGEDVSVLPMCNHSFHVDCIETWLSENSSCPTCRGCAVDTKSRAAVSDRVVESEEDLWAVAGDRSDVGGSSSSSSNADLEVGADGRRFAHADRIPSTWAFMFSGLDRHMRVALC